MDFKRLFNLLMRNIKLCFMYSRIKHGFLFFKEIL